MGLYMAVRIISCVQIYSGYHFDRLKFLAVTLYICGHFENYASELMPYIDGRNEKYFIQVIHTTTYMVYLKIKVLL